VTIAQEMAAWEDPIRLCFYHWRQDFGQQMPESRKYPSPNELIGLVAACPE